MQAAQTAIQRFYTDTYSPTIRYLPASALNETVSDSTFTVQQLATKCAYYTTAGELLTGDTWEMLGTVSDQGTRHLIGKLVNAYNTSRQTWVSRGTPYQDNTNVQLDIDIVGNAATSMDTLVQKRGTYIGLWASMIQAIQTFVRGRITATKETYAFGSATGNVTVNSRSTRALGQAMSPVVFTLSVGAQCVGSHMGATAVGFAYGTAANPTKSDGNAVAVLASEFTATLTGLQVNTVYFIRAYAERNGQTVYGNTLQYRHGVAPQVTTAAIQRSAGAIVVGGSLGDTQGAPITACGVVWGTSQNPTIALTTRTIALQQSGTFSASLTGLAAGTTYYVRAYATNTFGTTYGESLSFLAPTPPTVTLNDATALTTTGMTLNLTVGNAGSSTVTEQGFYWSTTSMTTPLPADRKVVGSPFTITNLTKYYSGTSPIIYVIAYATSQDGTGFSAQRQFTYTMAAVPTINTVRVSFIKNTEAYLNCSVNATGTSTVAVEYGFYYSTSQITLPTTVNTVLPTSNTLFKVTTSLVENLTNAPFAIALTLPRSYGSTKTWYVVGYAISQDGIGYSTNISFIQPMAALPSITASTLGNIKFTSVMFSASFTIPTGDNSNTFIEYGFFYSMSNTSVSNTPPTATKIILSQSQTAASVTTPFSTPRVTLNSTNSAKTWYFRAYMINSDNQIAYSVVQSFIQPARTWSALKSTTTLPGRCNAIAGSRGTLFIGGAFGSADGDTNAKYIAKWEGSSWSALGAGLSGHCLSIAINESNGNVYAGGNFSTVDGSKTANNIAVWNRTSWSALGTGLDGYCYAIAVAPNGTVYAGGTFPKADGKTVNYIAKWNGSSWSALGTGLNSYCEAIAIASDGTVYAGGRFTTADGKPANYIAKWDGSTWSALGDGLGASCSAMAIASDGTLYAEYSVFVQGATAGQSYTNAYLMRWKDNEWVNMRPPSRVTAIATSINNTVIIGTQYKVYQLNNADNSWTDLASCDNTVNTIVIDSSSNNDLADNVIYIGGSFVKINNAQMQYISKSP